MELKEKISIENFDDRKFRVRLVEADDQGEAAFTHYLHNYKNGVSQFFKEGALQNILKLYAYKYPQVKKDSVAAEEAHQY